jgi:hypothetical protein
MACTARRAYAPTTGRPSRCQTVTMTYTPTTSAALVSEPDCPARTAIAPGSSDFSAPACRSSSGRFQPGSLVPTSSPQMSISSGQGPRDFRWGEELVSASGRLRARPARQALRVGRRGSQRLRLLGVGVASVAGRRPGVGADDRCHPVGQVHQRHRDPSLVHLRPGDLVFYPYRPRDPGSIHHVAMAIGQGRMVEAYGPGVPVRVVRLRRSGLYAAARPGP